MDGPSRLCARRGYRRTPLLATVHLRGTQMPQIVTNEKGTPRRVRRYLTQDYVIRLISCEKGRG